MRLVREIIICIRGQWGNSSNIIVQLFTLHCFFLTLITAFYIFSTIYPHLHLQFSHFFYFYFLFLTFLARRQILNSADLISLQPACNITKINITSYSATAEKLSFYQTKCPIFSIMQEIWWRYYLSLLALIASNIFFIKISCGS